MDLSSAARLDPPNGRPVPRRDHRWSPRRTGRLLATALAALVVGSGVGVGVAAPAGATTTPRWATFCANHPRTINGHCVLHPPTGLTASAATATGATLAWVPVAGASRYVVYADGSVVGSPTTPSLTDTSRAAGSTTSYTVATRNAAGQSVPGPAVRVTILPAAPSGLVAVPGDGLVALSWSAVHGATGYTVQSTGVPVATTATTAVTLTGLTDGTTYMLRVVATDPSGPSAPSAVVLAAPVLPLPTAPTALAASAVTASGASLTWDPVPGATGYLVSDDGTSIGTTTDATFTDTGAAAGAPATYSVAAVNPSGTGPAVDVDVLTRPGAVGPVHAAAVTASGATLSWEPVAGATSYEVSSDGSPLATVTGTDYTDRSAPPGTTHGYSVAAVDSSGAGAASPPTPVTILPAAPMDLAASAVTVYGATLTWDPVVGATDYVVLVGGSPVATLTQPGYTDTTCAPGTVVDYSVAAVDSAGSGASADPVTVVTLPGEPTGLAAADVTATGATLTWDPVVGATGYEIVADGTVVATTASPGYTDTTAAAGSTVTYAVAATDASGSGPSAVTDVVTLPAAPSGLAATAVTAAGATVTWDPVVGATSYLVAAGGTWVATVTAPTYTDTASPSGAPVTYTVTAADASGTGDASAPVDVVTLPAAPTGLAVTAVGGAGATLTWNPVVGAVRYTVYGAAHPVLTTTATTLTDGGEAPGATVHYTVTAWDETGESTNSPVVQVVLVPAAPTAVTAYPADGALNVRWAPVAGATAYRVTVAGGASTVVTAPAATVGGLADGTTYAVAVAATDAAGTSAWSAPATGVPTVATTPSTAFGLLDMEGVDTHSSYGTTPYANVAQTERLLGQLGVHHIRDSLAYGASGPQLAQLAFYNAVHAQGIGVDLILSPNGSTTDLTARLGTVAASLATAVDVLEAPNELNGSGRTDWAAQDIAYQQALYAGVTGNPALRATRVLGPSLNNSLALQNGDQGYLALGDLSSLFDLGNIHVYPGGRTPTWNMDATLAAERSVSGTKTVWVSESGYHDAVNASGNFSVTDGAAATYLPRLLLEWHQRGAGRVNLYELYDEQADPNQSNYQEHFGLVGLDGTPKAQFAALAAFNGLLADTSASFPLTPLTYQVSAGGAKVSSMLLEKSSGQYVLFLWQDVSVSNTATSPPTPVVVPPTPVTVSLGAPAASITQYRPSLSPAAQATAADTATVTVGLQGDATALVIRP
jgi:hypothetical protein